MKKFKSFFFQNRQIPASAFQMKLTIVKLVIDRIDFPVMHFFLQIREKLKNIYIFFIIVEHLRYFNNTKKHTLIMQ